MLVMLHIFQTFSCGCPSIAIPFQPKFENYNLNNKLMAMKFRPHDIDEWDLDMNKILRNKCKALERKDWLEHEKSMSNCQSIIVNIGFVLYVTTNRTQ